MKYTAQVTLRLTKVTLKIMLKITSKLYVNVISDYRNVTWVIMPTITTLCTTRINKIKYRKKTNG